MSQAENFQWTFTVTHVDQLRRLLTKKGPDGMIEIDGWEVVNPHHGDPEIDSVHGFITKALINLKHHVVVVDPIILAAVKEQVTELEAYLSGNKLPFEWVLTDKTGQSDMYMKGGSDRDDAPSVIAEFPECAFVGEKLLPSLDLDGFAAYMTQHADLKVIVMNGAGISTSAGISDYRSAGGVFSRMMAERPDLVAAGKTPEDLFSIQHFRKAPQDFYERLKGMYTSMENVSPTPAHKFLRLLDERGVLLRCYTQNVDGLERKAGLSPEKLVEVHGSLLSCSGIETGKACNFDEFTHALRHDDWENLREKHGELIKPDIVMYGQALPPRFEECFASDIAQCNCLIVFGTSLRVAPINKLVGSVPTKAPRLLVNREAVGLQRSHPKEEDDKGPGATLRNGFKFEGERAYRDVWFGGQCDEAAAQLARGFGAQL